MRSSFHQDLEVRGRRWYVTSKIPLRCRSPGASRRISICWEEVMEHQHRRCSRVDGIGAHVYNTWSARLDGRGNPWGITVVGFKRTQTAPWHWREVGQRLQGLNGDYAQAWQTQAPSEVPSGTFDLVVQAAWGQTGSPIDGPTC